MMPGPGGAVTLSRRMQVIFMAIAEAPWTNIKTLNSLAAANATLVYLAAASPLGWKLEEWLVNSVLIFIASWLGISMAGAGIKRATYKPAPPHGPDIEDAQAGATVTPEKPAVPRAGDKPRDVAVVEGMEAVASRQRAAIPDVEGEGD